MKRLLSYTLSALILTSAMGGRIKAEEDVYKKVLKQDILCLMLAYPETIKSIEADDRGYVFLKTISGNKILYDDKQVKSNEGKLNNPDLQDTMEQLYPLEFPKGIMPENFDPGRVRSYTLLKEVYGKNAEDIKKNLKNVKVGYRNFQFNSKNNAAAYLTLAVRELAPLSFSNKEISNILFSASGTFNYRCISGTSRLSPHAFGIAIDLVSNKNDYWKWANSKEGEKRMLSYPRELVQILENNYFIWGGKWNHFDTLHFEYRPEIILKTKYFGNSTQIDKVWHEGAPIENEFIKSKINEIDNIVR